MHASDDLSCVGLGPLFVCDEFFLLLMPKRISVDTLVLKRSIMRSWDVLVDLSLVDLA